jgi:hypothetical protein
MSRVAAVVPYLLVAIPQIASGVCVSKGCGPENAAVVQALRRQVQAQCDCTGVANAKAYRRCVSRVVEEQRKAGALPKPCAKAIRKCELNSTCGRAGVVVCCRWTKSGRLRATVVKSQAQCDGSICESFNHPVDACDASTSTLCAELPVTTTTAQVVPTSTTSSTTSTSVPPNGPFLPTPNPDPCEGVDARCESALSPPFTLVSTDVDGLISTAVSDRSGPVLTLAWTRQGDLVELVMTFPRLPPVRSPQEEVPATLARANLTAAMLIGLNSRGEAPAAFDHHGCDDIAQPITCTSAGGCCDKHDACIAESCTGAGDSGNVGICALKLALLIQCILNDPSRDCLAEHPQCSQQCQACHTDVESCIAGCFVSIFPSCPGPSECCEEDNCGEPRQCPVPVDQLSISQQTDSASPQATCEEEPDGSGEDWGDPHLVTFDRLAYDFQAVGEFVLVRSLDDGLEIQIRTQPWGDQQVVSVNGAVATRVAGDRVGIYADRNPPVRVNGIATTLEQGGLPLPGGGSLETAGERYTVRWPDGSALRANVLADHLDIEVFLPSTRRGRLAGLLGNFDGALDNDVVPRDGSFVGPSPSFSEFYSHYAESWRIGQTESLFDYTGTDTTATFTDRAFPKAAVSSATLATDIRQRVEQVCRSRGVIDPIFLDACILDVALTGDPAFAASATQFRRPKGRLVGSAYFNGFEGPIGAEWSSTSTDTTPIDARRFLGQFDNATVSLTLGDLPPHTELSISFDLILIQSWDGNDPVFGDDVWDLSIRGSAPLLHTTFANYADGRQAYPGSHPGGDNPALSGAAEVQTLGYFYITPADSVYRLSFRFAHSASSVIFDFSGIGLQGIGDESWGLDNVEVTTNASPVVVSQ